MVLSLPMVVVALVLSLPVSQKPRATPRTRTERALCRGLHNNRFGKENLRTNSLPPPLARGVPLLVLTSAVYDGKPEEAREAAGNNNVDVPSLLNGVAAARVGAAAGVGTGTGAVGVVVVAFMLICWMARARS